MTSVVQRIGEWIRRLAGSKQPELSPEESEQLTALFRERYHSFRVLLTANGRWNLDRFSYQDNRALADAFTEEVPVATFDLYGQEIEVALHHFLRPEEKFAGLDELTAQMERDCDKARKLLTALAP